MRKKRTAIDISLERLFYTVVLGSATYYAVFEMLAEL